MKFNLIDKIEQLTPRTIVAVKYVSLAEEYLGDHFPTFPVLPGVMMLEAATQAAAWLLHREHDFARSMAVLKEARNIKYGHFVAPGHHLRVQVDAIAMTADGGSFKASASVGPVEADAPGSAAQAFAGRIELAYFDLGARQPELASVDPPLRAHNRQRWAVLAQASQGSITV